MSSDKELALLLQRYTAKSKNVGESSKSELDVVDEIKKGFTDHAGFPRSSSEHGGDGNQKYRTALGDMITVVNVI